MIGVQAVAVIGVVVGVGFVGLFWSLQGRAASAQAPVPPHGAPAPAGQLGGRNRGRTVWALALVVGLVGAAVTGWPVAVPIGAVGVVGLAKALHGGDKRGAARRVEAVATWTELLRDTLIASAGLSQAIVATAPVAPPELRSEISSLADRVTSGVPLVKALRAFADDVSDSSADLVVCALILAADAQAQRLSDLLTSLADSIREEVSLRLRVDAGRASARSGVRTIVAFSIGFAAVLVVVSRPYLAPFRTSVGQLMLLVIAVFYGSGIWLMTRLVRQESPERLLGIESPS